MKLWWNEATCLVGLPNTLLNIVALHNLGSNRQLLENVASLAVIRLLTSLIPRLPAPECEHWSSVGGESLAHVSAVKGHVEREYKALIVRGRTWRLRTGKRAKVVDNLLHISSYWGAKIIHIKRWVHSWLNNVQSIVFFRLLHERYQALPVYTYSCSGVGEPGNEASSWPHMLLFVYAIRLSPFFIPAGCTVWISNPTMNVGTMTYMELPGGVQLWMSLWCQL